MMGLIDRAGSLEHLSRDDLERSMREEGGPATPSAAVHELVRREPAREKDHLLRLMAGAHLAEGARSVVIRRLGERSDPESLGALAAALSSDRPHEVRLAANALVGHGNHEALEALAALRLDADHPARRAVERAHTMIALRLGERGHLQPKLQVAQSALMPRSHVRAEPCRTVSASEIEEVASDIERSVAPRRVDLSQACEISCGRKRRWILLDASLGRGATTLRAIGHPTIAAVILNAPGAGAPLSVFAHVLAEPAGGGIDIRVMHHRGEVVGFGRAEERGHALTFELEIPESHLVPATRYSGELDLMTGGLSVAGAQGEANVSERNNESRRPKPMAPPRS